jgi:glycyl-tRNA synthetase
MAGRSVYLISDVDMSFYSERDTTNQLIGPIDDVIGVVTALVQGSMNWVEACQRLAVYDGVQAVD